MYKRNFYSNIRLKLSILFLFYFSGLQGFSQVSVARKWNEILLETIRNDFARPPVQARNLFHFSIAVYDAWAVYDPVAAPYVLGNTIDGITYSFTGIPAVNPGDTLASMNMAISYAAYRFLSHRFSSVPTPTPLAIKARFDSLMINLGYDTSYHGTNYMAGTPADLGNYIAEKVIEMGLNDNSHQIQNYTYFNYVPVNTPLVVKDTGITMQNVNRWQPLYIVGALDQGGNPINPTQKFLQPEWGRVTPFAMTPLDAIYYFRNGIIYTVYHDPGMMPKLSLTDTSDVSSQLFKWGHSMVSIWSSHLDPNDTTTIDISPASKGNGNYYPSNFSAQQAFYHYFEGGDTSKGYTVNPITNLPYTPQLVKRGDYARVVSQFWADGPRSETPPGHWFYILNKVSDNPLFVKKYEGVGPTLSNLEWDVKSYFALGGAMHDAAIAAWSVKGWYDSPRPISALRLMSQLGQCTDSLLPHYHRGGLPLIPGYIELIQAGDSLAGASNENVNKIKLFTWKGFHYIADSSTDVAGAGWILGESWMPYQRKTFVTPPFAGYVSGHSTYSRAAAELLTLITGSPYFPGGLSETIIPANSNFLMFEKGPSTDINLQWAAYRDASDESSLSRIWGGIHPPFDDIKGRRMGEQIAANAHYLSKNYFSNVALPVDLSYYHASEDNCEIKIEWTTLSEKNNSHFEIWKSTNGFDFEKLAEVKAATNGDIKNQYRYFDKNVHKINFYQLISKDIDGQSYLHGVRDVNGMNCLEGHNTFISSAYPNPVLSDDIYFDINMNKSNESVLVQLLDSKGSIFYSKQSNLMHGLNKMYYKFSSFPKGNYLLQIEVSDGTKSTQKISVN
jgi:hypothetical protein